MGLLAKEKGSGDFTPVPEGIHWAICYGLYDLGTQHSEKFGNNNRQVLIVWELPDIRIELESEAGEKLNLPKSISKRYTLSLSAKANLRKDLESWRGQRFTAEELKGFDLQKLLGANCQLQVLHHKADDKTFANVAAIVPLIKGMEKKKAENPLRFFSFDDGIDIPEGTPEWVMEIIQESFEWKGKGQKTEEPPPPSWLQGGPEPPQQPTDDVPF